MKKNIISLAVAATVLGAAAAQAGQYVNPDKTGEVLLFPFYNADNGNATNMHIVNTTAAVKAVKIRFVEYKNSDEVLDFNVYLSANDHFAFGVIKNPNGTGAAVITSDNSCTVPALGSANGEFAGSTTENADGSTTRTQPFVNYLFAKDVDTSIERTLTGHVEVIEMGVVANVDTKKGAHAAFATHGATGVPLSCAGLDASWSAGSWKADASAGMSAPTGGLYGLSYHINVEAAAAFGFEPTALDDWADGQSHSDPGTLSPSITSGVKTAAIKHGLGGDQHIELTFASGIEATSATLQTVSLSNDVMINSAIGGMTDWVVSFPTKRAHVDTGAADVVPPFTGKWLGTVGTTTKKEQPACEKVTISQWDREEAYTANSNGFSPSPAATTTKICNETAVIAMGTGAASALSVTTGLTNLTFPYSEGWQQMSFDQAMQDTDKIFVKGLPAIGFAAYKVNNGAMSYGNATEHKTDTALSSGATIQPS
jgi:hypothetical protein